MTDSFRKQQKESEASRLFDFTDDDFDFSDDIFEPAGNDDDDTDDDDNTDNEPDLRSRLEPPLKAEVLQPLENPRQELNKLIGCDDIKRRIEELTQLNNYNGLMRQYNPQGKPHALSLHSIFFGKPGTGKTTVCKIYGSLLKEAGMLSKGHVVVCNRSTFIGTNFGDEERTTRQAVEMARGGVLMIDEAYLLNSEHKQDPGKLVIPLLMDILGDEKQRDLAVILCGYKEPMMQLIELNPGLESRFPNRFEFADFTVEQLLDISLIRLKEYGYHFTRAALLKFKTLLTDAYAQRDPMTWGNARFIANQLDRIYLCHARRCVGLKHPDRAHLLSITPADIEPIEVPKAKAKRKIGFSV